MDRLNLKKIARVLHVDNLITFQAHTNALLLELSKNLDIGLMGLNIVQIPFIMCYYFNGSIQVGN